MLYKAYPLDKFLGLFAKLRKATISFVISVPRQCPRTHAVPTVYIRLPTGTKHHNRNICWRYCQPDLS